MSTLVEFIETPSNFTYERELIHTYYTGNFNHKTIINRFNNSCDLVRELFAKSQALFQQNLNNPAWDEVEPYDDWYARDRAIGVAWTKAIDRAYRGLFLFEGGNIENFYEDLKRIADERGELGLLTDEFSALINTAFRNVLGDRFDTLNNTDKVYLRSGVVRYLHNLSTHNQSTAVIGCVLHEEERRDFVRKTGGNPDEVYSFAHKVKTSLDYKLNWDFMLVLSELITLLT